MERGMTRGTGAYCPQCGYQYEGTPNFCPNCGTALGGRSYGAAEAPPGGVEVIASRIKTGVPGFVREALHANEPVLGAFSASLFDHHKTGVSLAHDKFVLTPERIIVYHTGLFHKGMGEIPYKMITGVSYERGLVHGKVIVDAANAGLTMDGIGNADAAFAEKVIAAGVAGRRFEASEPAVYPTPFGAVTRFAFGALVMIVIGVMLLELAVNILR